jgi:hypothetical protein
VKRPKRTPKCALHFERDLDLAARAPLVVLDDTFCLTAPHMAVLRRFQPTGYPRA